MSVTCLQVIYEVNFFKKIFEAFASYSRKKNIWSSLQGKTLVLALMWSKVLLGRKKTKDGSEPILKSEHVLYSVRT
jgi:hypothetical protein